MEGDRKMMNLGWSRLQKIISIVIFVIFCTSSSYSSERIIPLTNLNAPATIALDDERIYIEDGPTIKLFNRIEYEFIKNIGREGQGPGEFQYTAVPQVLSEKLVVSSTNKVSYFTLSGDFVKDKRHNIFSTPVRVVKNNYVGHIWVFKEDYVAYILYDPDFKPIKELHRGKALIHPNRRREFFEIHFYDTYKDKIVVAHREGFVIDIFDSEGSILRSIEHKIKPVPFTNEDKKNVVKYWKESGLEQWQIDRLLDRTDFPDFYPPIQTGRLADGENICDNLHKKRKQARMLNF